MNALTPYLLFNGNCADAMNFYKSCFGGQLELMTNESAPKDACPSDMKLDPKQIMHACLTSGDLTLMASDNPISKPVLGDNISMTIQCKTKEETDKLFKDLSTGGTVTMPLADTFWGAYFGTVQDKFGFHWMLNCPLNT